MHGGWPRRVMIVCRGDGRQVTRASWFESDFSSRCSPEADCGPDLLRPTPAVLILPTPFCLLAQDHAKVFWGVSTGLCLLVSQVVVAHSLRVPGTRQATETSSGQGSPPANDDLSSP